MKTTYYDVSLCRDDNVIKAVRKDKRPVVKCPIDECFVCDEISRDERITTSLLPGEFGRLTLTANKNLLNTRLENFYSCNVKSKYITETIKNLVEIGYRLFSSYTSHKPNGELDVSLILVGSGERLARERVVLNKLYDNRENIIRSYNDLISNIDTIKESEDSYVREAGNKFYTWIENTFTGELFKNK